MKLIDFQHDSPVCCPADELMRYVSKNYLEGVRSALQFQEKFIEHVTKVKYNISQKLNTPLEDITFIGVHNRRTVSLNHLGQFLIENRPVAEKV